MTEKRFKTVCNCKINFFKVYQQKYPPPLIPPRGEVNAADAFDIGSFDEEDTKGWFHYLWI